MSNVVNTIKYIVLGLSECTNLVSIFDKAFYGCSKVIEVKLLVV